MKRVIFGLGMLPDIVEQGLRQAGVEIDAFTVEKTFCKDAAHNGIAIIPFEDLRRCLGEAIGIYICVGYNGMNALRERIYHLSKKMGLSVLSFVHDSALILTKEIGEGNIILERAVVAPFVTLGNCNIIYTNCVIGHHSSCGDFNFFSTSVSVAGAVKIGNRCFLGNNSTTRDHISLADRTLLGAGVYIDHSTNENDAIVPSAPCRKSGRKSFQFFD